MPRTRVLTLVVCASCRIGFDPIESSAPSDSGPIGTPAIFRSVGYGTLSPLASGADGPVDIVDAVATFTTPLPDRVGVGDALEYDSDRDGALDSIGFIYLRRSSLIFELATERGDPLPSVGGPITTWRLSRAHVSLNAAVNDSPNPSLVIPFDSTFSVYDLVTNERTRTIACYADAPDDSAPVVSGRWLTSPTYHLRIFAPAAADDVGASQRHPGAWDPSRFTLVTAPSSIDRALLVTDTDVELEGLQIFVNNDGAATDLPYAIAFDNTARPTTSWVSHTIIRGSGIIGAGSIPRGIFLPGNSPPVTLYAWNNVMYSVRGYGIEVKAPSHRAVVSNNTFIDCDHGVQAEVGSSTVIRNNVALGGTSPAFGVGNGAATGAANFSSDSSAPLYGVGAQLPSADPLTYFVGAMNPHLILSAANASALIDVGDDLSTNSDLSFSDDIDHNPRGSKWDAGADELDP